MTPPHFGPPTITQSAGVLRIMVFFLILVGSVGVLCNVGFRFAYEYKGVTFDWSRLWWIVPICLCWYGVHLLYLLLVADDAVFSKTLDELSWKQIVLPSLLAATHALSAIGSGLQYFDMPEGHLSHSAAIATFVLLYAFWVAKEFPEYSHHRRAKSKTTRRGFDSLVWIVVDSVSVLLLSTYLVLHLLETRVDSVGAFAKGFRGLCHPYLGVKDLFVLITLVIWFGMQCVANIFRDEVAVYDGEKYLDQCAIDVADSLSASDLPATRVVDALGITTHIPKDLTCIFGCERGQRFSEIDQLLELRAMSKGTNVVGFDHNGEWKTAFEDRVSAIVGENGACRFESDRSLFAEQCRAARILANIHHCYDPTDVDAFARCVELAPKNCLVLVRGSHMSTLFGGFMLISALQNQSPTLHHAWTTLHVRSLQSRLSLSPLEVVDGQWHRKPNTDVPKPILLIRQNCLLNDDSLRAITRIAERTFGTRVGELVGRTLGHTYELRGGLAPVELANDDVVFAWIK